MDAEPGLLGLIARSGPRNKLGVAIAVLTILLALVFIRKLRADGDHTVVNVINLFDIKDHVLLSGLIPEYCNARRLLNNFFATAHSVCD